MTPVGEPSISMKLSNPGEPPVPVGILNFIKEGKKFLIAGHEDPDGDCVGSQMALASVLQRLGKEVVLCTGEPFRRTELKAYEKFFLVVSDENAGFNEAEFRVILLDCSGLDRSGKLSTFLKKFPIAIIDHHVTGASDKAAFSAAALYYIDRSAPSTTILVMKLIQTLGLEIVREEAESLFFGLCTDTGFFRHVDRGGELTFQAAASLVSLGANPKAAYSAIYGGKSLNSRRLIGHALVRAESFFEGKLIVSSQTYEEISSLSKEGRDSDNLYQLLQSVVDTEVVVIIHQVTPEKCSVGLRSRSWVDVGNIAKSFGGGGHKNASGFSFTGSFEGLKQEIIKTFEKILI